MMPKRLTFMPKMSMYYKMKSPKRANFNQLNPQNDFDVGVVVLRKDITKPHFKPICLPRPKTTPYAKATYLVSWGSHAEYQADGTRRLIWG